MLKQPDSNERFPAKLLILTRIILTIRQGRSTRSITQMSIHVIEQKGSYVEHESMKQVPSLEFQLTILKGGNCSAQPDTYLWCEHSTSGKQNIS